ncbi:MAG: hypothetical protein ACI9G1_001852, partial [Pirellulaceae bacterium]
YQKDTYFRPTDIVSLNSGGAMEISSETHDSLVVDGL